MKSLMNSETLVLTIYVYLSLHIICSLSHRMWSEDTAGLSHDRIAVTLLSEGMKDSILLFLKEKDDTQTF